VRPHLNTWDVHYDAAGLERAPAEPMGARVDEGHLVGRWASAGEVQRAVERHHDKHITG
jgi:hypothetical protein